MEKLFLALLFASFSLLAQESDIFKVYHSKVISGEITEANAFSHLDGLEAKLYRDANSFFDELAIVEREVNFIAPKDNLRDMLTKWESHYQDQDLDGLFKKAARDPDAILNNPQYKKIFKDNRKYSHIVRSTFYVFDEEHAAPKKMEKFVKPFGKLNDAIVAQDHEGIKKYSAKTLEARKEIQSQKVLAKFKSINRPKLIEHLANVRKNVTSLLGQSVFSPHDYHYIRKQFKEFLVIYSNLDAYVPHPKLEVLDGYITKLGELNDIYTDLKFRFGLDIEQHQMKFPERFKYEIGQGLSSLEEDLVSIHLGKSCHSFYKINAP